MGGETGGMDGKSEGGGIREATTRHGEKEGRGTREVMMKDGGGSDRFTLCCAKVIIVGLI